MRTRIAALFGAALIVLTACSGGGGVSAKQEAQLYSRWIGCLRQQGLPGLPDPTIDTQGRVHLILPSPASFDTYTAASRNCQLLRQVANASVGRPALNTSQLSEFTKCMRDHGVLGYQVPDPNAIQEAPNSPAFDAAQRSCGLPPIGKGGVIISCCAVKPG
jgi:hypothetical protein